jgi:stage V sporulation protein AA
LSEIYVKPNKKYITGKLGGVHISDIAEVYAEDSLKKRVDKIKLMEINSETDKCYLISVIDIVRAINTALPGHTISNLGEMDTVVEFNKKTGKSNTWWQYVKITFVSLLLLAGSATAIMSFHSDAQIPVIFENYYYMFFNERVKNPMIIDLPYSIGLAVGIITFFNHFSGKKLTSDPTPIEVEMTSYENQVEDNIIDTLSTEKNYKKGSKDGSN